MDKEEGEMSDEFMEVDDEVAPALSHVEEDKCAVIYKAEKHGPVVQKLEKVDASKLEERANRFGLNLTGSRVVTQKQIDELYINCGVDSANERHFRFDAIHLTGIEGLTDKEIFEYLEDFKPVSLEWVDDDSCNIVCQDHISAALALLVHSRNIVQEEIKELLAKKSPHYWREGMPHPKKDLILMRFATNAEKTNVKKKSRSKQEVYHEKELDPATKNPWGDLCKSWGVYDHQEVFQRKLPKDEFEEEADEPRPQIRIKNKNLAHRLGKRPVKVESSDEEDDDSLSDSEWKKKSKTPRMRMHADDVEAKLKKQESYRAIKEAQKEIYAPLSIEIDNSHKGYTPRQTTKLSDKFKFHNKSNIESRKNTIHSRLGSKISRVDNSGSDDDYQLAPVDTDDDDDDDDHIVSTVQRVASDKGSNASIWSRLETQTKNHGDKNDLRQRLKPKERSNKKPSDLRSRLEKSKHSNLRIEIDNSKYK